MSLSTTIRLLAFPPLSSPPPRTSRLPPLRRSRPVSAPYSSPDGSPPPYALSDDSPPPPSDIKPATVAPNESRTGGVSYGVMVGLILGAITVVLGVAIQVYRYRRKKRKNTVRRAPYDKDHEGTILPLAQPVSPSPHNDFGPVFSQTTFTYKELSKATDNFSKANLLGQGGFGYVYKGVLSNGKEVAVKQLKIGSGQGEREFQAEIDTISRIHHRHLVSLVGHCINKAKRLLVYEFLPNSTLDFHLHGKDRPNMNWATRVKIAVGSAKGLAYLHEECQPKIIHRDIKAANILLDHNFEAKVADFGLAKYFLDTETHVSTRVMGTFGYMAPEYASSGKLTEKSDVFSFGVVLLELITGRLPIARTESFFDDSIVNWARPLLQQALQADNYDALVDPKLQKDHDSTQMARMIACAAACVNPSAWLRPQMSQIARAIEGNMSLEDLNEGTTSGNGRNHTLYGVSDYNPDQYREDLVEFRKLALKSQELGSSEYKAFCRDYGMNSSSSS